jgi:sulfite reductase (ferredoxin)
MVEGEQMSTRDLAREGRADRSKQSARKREDKRGKGQWALGYMEPLNAPERMKRDDDGMNCRVRIENIYSKKGFRSIDKGDLRGRFKWWGLYTQRKQGLPGGVTASAEPEELEDEFFMMRIRIPGGLLTSEQTRVIAQISERYGRDIADITDRQNIQLHWIRIEDVPTIWEKLEAVGLSTTEACGDVPRNILGCPIAGVASDELIDPSDIIQDIAATVAVDPQFTNLPRKYKTTVTGCAHQCAQHEINCLSFVAVDKDGEIGFDVWIGGGLSSNPHIAQRIGAFVAPDKVAEVWGAVTALYRDYGYRRVRNRARLKFLMADWGPEKMRQVLQDEFLGYELPDGPAPAPSVTATRDHVGVFEQRDGRHTVGFSARAGRINGHQLRQVADLADRYGSGSVRLTTQQKAVIVDVAQPDALVNALEEIGLEVNGSPFRRSTMACTGIEFCKLALSETKSRAQQLYAELTERFPAFTEDIRIHINGCPNSCARFQIADIGFMGCVAERPDGTSSDAFLVTLGGGLGDELAFGRRVRGLRVFGEDLTEYTAVLLERYIHNGGDAETFSDFVNALDDEQFARFAEPPSGMTRAR